ncbi:unnamed protein product [Cylindrotheca closterium]|uniref:Casein kinase I n=1 Tax=Cylindrotheca closterium TaxID=2856 RepID=A0AAD2CVR4_9STRA|nr:unnamed protein product [Cylindrotheca closterium]
MAPSAKGVEILKGPKAKWKIGKKLGSGACATVYSLETIDGNLTEYAVKVVPVPTKKTKKQNSEGEINARLLHFEHLVYSNILPDIRGTHVPRMPFSKNEPPSQGEAGGFKFMILEKMDYELSNIVPALLRTKGTSIDFGPIAVKLVECIQAVQERKQVVVDIKPDNFMLTCDKGKGSTDAQKLASRIRLLDLALVKPWKSMESHRENEGTSGLAGTPLYASMNVHDGQTPSRRDDFESIGYVIAELIMKIVAGDPSLQLPWSSGTSDEAIGRMKEENMNDPNSIFFQQLGSKAVVKIVSEYMDEVRNYTFKKTPNYESLIQILSKLKISRSAKAPAPATKVRASNKKTPLRTATAGTSSRRTRAQKRASSSNDDDDEVQVVESPSKMARDESSTMDAEEEIFIDCSQDWTDAQPEPHYATPRDESDDDSFGTATMDWEATVDENEEPRKPAAKSAAARGVTVLVDAGPHKGRSFNMIKGQTDKIVIGRNPLSATGETVFALSDDDKVEDSHIQLELAVTKKLTAVRVVDLKSDSGTFVGQEKIRSGKDYRIFTGQSVRIGESELTIKKLDPSATKEVVKPTAIAGRASRSARSTRASRSSTKSTPEPEEVIELSPSSTNSKPKAGLKRRGLQLVVTEGPHKGESYALESGGDETFIIGQNPTSSVGTVIKLKKDKSLKATHLRIDLNVAKKLVTVSITDKSKGRTTVNRNTVNKGRAFINDIIKIGDSVLDIQPL